MARNIAVRRGTDDVQDRKRERGCGCEGIIKMAWVKERVERKRGGVWLKVAAS
jgi:hypothetical protein